MIVCSCQGVTDREVRAACQSAGLADTCPAGKGCGGCIATIKAIRDQIEQGSDRRQNSPRGDSAAANLQNRDGR